MNVFVLDENPNVAAQALCDKHLIKMQLESAQLLSTVVYLRTGVTHAGLYKPTHIHHPCTQHMVKSWAYTQWVFNNARGMNAEYRLRYRKVYSHASYFISVQAKAILEALEWPSETELVVPLAIHESIKGDRTHAPIAEAVQLYRQYYIEHKAHIATWNKSVQPSWFVRIEQSDTQ